MKNRKEIENKLLSLQDRKIFRYFSNETKYVI